MGGRRLLYLSLWRHLLLRGGKLLLLQPGGRESRQRLQLLGVGFRRDVLVFVRVLQAVLGEVSHLRCKERGRSQIHLRTTQTEMTPSILSEL